MKSARRDILKFAGGAAAGAVFTPVPWRLLGDSAIWTQNWSWMPRVPRGESSYRETRCALCPAACAMKAHCVGETPVGMIPAERSVCPAGIVGHHLAIHPLRLKKTLHNATESSKDAALEAARTAAGLGGVAVLDLLPGRVASRLHRENMARMKGHYLTAPPVEGATAQALSRLLPAEEPLVAELSAARTVLSVSTPLCEGWASPALVTKPQFYLIQADVRKSYTAERAEEWLRLQPGGEAALLLALLKLVLEERGAQVGGSAVAIEELRSVQLEQLCARAGVTAETVRGVARRLMHEPAAVIADGDPAGGPLGHTAQAAAAALNAGLGLSAWRQTNCPMAGESLAGVPDRSLHLLMVDAPLPGLALPWQMVTPKLAGDGAVVVALTWNREQFASVADWQVPVPVYLEGKHELPPAFDTASRAAGVSEGWLAPPEDAVCAADFVAEVAGGPAGYAEAVAEAAKASPVSANPAKPVRLLPDDLRIAKLVEAALAPPAPVTVVAHGWRLAGVSPLLGKLWKEADLMRGPNTAYTHPDTAPKVPKAQPVADGSVQRGVVELCAGPGFVQQCRPAPDGGWRPANSQTEVRS